MAKLDQEKLELVKKCGFLGVEVESPGEMHDSDLIGKIVGQ